MSKRHGFDEFVFLQTVIFLSAWLWLLEVHLAEMGSCCPPGGQNQRILEDAPMCLISQFLICQTSYNKIQWHPFSLIYLLAVKYLEQKFKCSFQKFPCPYIYVSCMKFESSLATEDISVTQATHANNYLQIQVMEIIKFKLMNPVQSLICLCGAHISAGTLYRLICDQLKDPVSPPVVRDRWKISSSLPHGALCYSKSKISVFSMIFKKQFINQPPAEI